MPSLVKPVIVFYRLQGKRVPKGTPGATKVKRRSKKWYGQGIPGFPPRKRIPLATDKTVAQQMLADLVRAGERSLAGMADLTQASKPMAVHIDDFEAHLRTRGTSEQQASLTMSRLRKLVEGMRTVADLTPERVQAFLSGLQARGREASVQTLNFYLAAARSFALWLAETGRVHANPLPRSKLRPGNVATDRRHDRRTLSPEELSNLLAATLTSHTTFRGLNGTARHALYLTAAGTGFRVGELADLTPELFDLNGSPPTVSLPASTDKARRSVTQPLPPGVAGVLRVFLAGKPASVPLWPGSWTEQAARMLRKDLESAGIAYVVQGADGPLYADFHALRHTYITSLERAGLSVKQAQTLARHADPKLTLARYTHATLADLGAAVGRVELGETKSEGAPPLELLAGLGLVLWAVFVAPAEKRP